MRRRNDPFDKPWVTIAAVVGVIAVVIIAIVFFMGSGNAGGAVPSGQSPSSQVTLVTPAPSGSSSPSTATTGTGINPAAIKELPTETVPGTGAFVKVSYIGGFAGIYGINGDMVTVRNSGERVLPLNATTGSVSATFHKEDGSTRHEIVVEIYKDGKALKVARNSSAFGEVSVSTQL
jgi:hypothetical protein